MHTDSTTKAVCFRIPNMFNQFFLTNYRVRIQDKVF